MRSQPRKAAFVFVNQPKRLKTCSQSPVSHSELQIARTIAPRDVSNDLQYFFTSFLQMNILADNNLHVELDLQNMMHGSSALRDAIYAVSALHRNKQAQFLLPSSPDCSQGSYFALQSYSKSVQSVQSLIERNEFTRDPSTLWSTFLLGLFEVCSPPSICSCGSNGNS